MQPEFSQRDLNRLDFDTLLTHAEAALHTRDYARATPLLREAVRRAPFRQDLRDRLADSLQANLMEQPEATRSNTRPPRSSAKRPLMTSRPEPAPTRPPEYPEVQSARTDRVASPINRLNPDRAQAADTIHPGRYESAPPARAFGGTAFRPAPVQRPVPKPHAAGEFSERHRRGPLSALFLGALAGMLLLGIMGGIGWYYLEYREFDTAAGTRMQAMVNSTVEQAQTYRERGEFSRAIEQLMTLPPTPVRDAHLADIYMDKGDRALTSRPQQLKAAIEDYRKAVEIRPEAPRYALALGQAFYTLAISQSDDEEAMRRSLEQARDTFEALLDRNPNNLDALNELAKVAGKLKDPVLQARTYRTIIEVAPEGSDEAKDAQRNLESLGFKS